MLNMQMGWQSPGSNPNQAPHWDDALVDTVRQITAQGGGQAVRLLVEKLGAPIDLQILDQIRESAPILADIAKQWRQNFGFDEDRWRTLENEIYSSLSLLTDTAAQIRKELETLKPQDRLQILKPLILAGIDPELLPLAWVQSEKIAEEEYEAKRNRYINALTDLESRKRLMYANIRQMLQADMDADLRTLSNARMFFNNMLNALLQRTRHLIGAIQQQMRLDNELKRDAFKRRQVFLDVWRKVVDNSRQFYEPAQAMQYLKSAYPWLKQLAEEADMDTSSFTEDRLLSNWVPDAKQLLAIAKRDTEVLHYRDFLDSGTVRNYAQARNLNARTEHELVKTGITEFRIFWGDVSRRIESDLMLHGQRGVYANAADNIIQFLRNYHNGNEAYQYNSLQELTSTYQALRNYISSQTGNLAAAERMAYANIADYWYTAHAMLLSARQRGYQTRGLPTVEPINMILNDNFTTNMAPSNPTAPNANAANAPNPQGAGNAGTAIWGWMAQPRSSGTQQGGNNPFFGNTIGE